MAYGSTLETAAARAAISKGDGPALERYLREGGNNPVQNLTGATANLIPGTNLFNRAAGITAILPNATGSQEVVKVVIQTLLTGNSIIKTAKNTDFMVGVLAHGTTTFGAASTHLLGGTNALLTITAASGGQKGSVLSFTDIAPNLWLAEGMLGSTTAAAIAGPWA